MTETSRLGADSRGTGHFHYSCSRARRIHSALIWISARIRVLSPLPVFLSSTSFSLDALSRKCLIVELNYDEQRKRKRRRRKMRGERTGTWTTLVSPFHRGRTCFYKRRGDALIASRGWRPVKANEKMAEELAITRRPLDRASNRDVPSLHKVRNALATFDTNIGRGVVLGSPQRRSSTAIRVGAWEAAWSQLWK